jgi:2Fe-2S ferredoxin
MPKVTFLPANKTVEARLNESLLDIAEQFGIPIAHECGGCCSCSTCHCIPSAETARNLSPMDEDEKDTLAALCDDRQAASRLGCQARVRGDVVVVVVNPE